MRRIRRASVRVVLPLLSCLAGVLATLSPASADPAKTGYPNSMASTGDSITRAVNTIPCSSFECPANSWSTGTNTTVNSHYNRILAANSLISGNNFNDAASGARMSSLNGQLLTVNTRNVDYVTILMGANDVCRPTEADMTSVSTFLSQFQTAMATLSAGSPDARIYVVSVPDIYQLWSILHTDSAALSSWATRGICQSMLANATSMAQTDIDRRARVRQRNIDFNTQLQQVCAQYIHCRFDNNAAFNLAFTPADVSTFDYFHPSLAGQATAAAISYGVTFDFTDNAAPVSNATTSPATAGMNGSLTASDDVGVSGIEYKLGSGGWVRYAAPVFVANGSTITWRAVDVNGNIEATSAYTASAPVSVGGIAVAPDVDELPRPARATGGRPGYPVAIGVLAAVTLSALGAWFALGRRR